MSIGLILEPAKLTVEPGQPGVVRLRVRNTGRVVDKVNLAVLGRTAGWATVNPPSINLYPGTEGNATVTFVPPRVPSTTAGTVPFAVRAESEEDPAGSAIEEGDLTVMPFRALTATMVPVTSYGRDEGRHTLNLVNGGNTAVMLAIDASDPDQLLQIGVGVPQVRVEPGATQPIGIVVRPSGDIGRRAGIRRPFDVRVRDESGTPAATVTGGFEVKADAASRWPMIAVAVAVGLALLVGSVVVASQLLPGFIGPGGELPSAAAGSIPPTDAPATAAPPTDAPPTEAPPTEPPPPTEAPPTEPPPTEPPPTEAPALVVGSYVGLTVAEAKARIEADGFTVGKVTSNEIFDPPEEWIVAEQAPSAGDSAPPGTPIELLAPSPEPIIQ
jgi:hypothetical protein